MTSFSASPNGVQSFPTDGNSVIKGIEIRIERTCLKNNKKSNVDRVLKVYWENGEGGLNGRLVWLDDAKYTCQA